MKIGGMRRLIIPSDMAYGSAQSASNIPPNSDLVFDIELMIPRIILGIHALSIGYDNAISRVLTDPLVRLYANKQYEADLAEHAETEFNKLAELLAKHH